MGNNHLKRSLISPSVATTPKQFKYINNNPSVMNGWNADGDSANVFISTRFTQADFQCFSDWSKQEMKSFWSFSDKLHDYTWRQVYDTSRKTEKAGLAYTKIPIDNYPKCEFKSKLDPQITLFELRVDGEKRVHGFRNKSIFYICWLDKDHKICN